MLSLTALTREIIGEKNLGGKDYDKAVKGEMSSSLNQTGSFFQKIIRYPEIARITTFAPLRIERPGSKLASGPILGVMEIVQDVSKDYKRIFKLQLLVVLTTTAVMTVLFLILRQIVKNGEEIIMEKNRERLKLREELDRARHLSSIGEMTAIISHEIKNPLGIIRSSAEHLSKKLTEVNKSDTFAKIIIEESGRMNQIINDFLSFAKPGEPLMNPCSINEILKKNIDFLKHELSKKNCSVTLDLDKNIPKTFADENKLYQSFLNIIINSMQAMPLGGEIFIATELKNNEIQIDIRDTGTGIPEEIIKKVKDPFFTTKTDGSGLGLGIVEQTVKNHKGKFIIENSSSGGAKITITLPVNKGDLF